MEVAAFIEIDTLASANGVEPEIAARIAQEVLEKVFEQLFIDYDSVEVIGNGQAVEVRVASDEEFFEDEEDEDEFWNCNSYDDDDEQGELVPV